MKMSNRKRTFFLTILTILLPSIAGLLLWDQLPEQIATHFNMHGQADGYSSRLFTIFGMPGLLALIQTFCYFVTTNDPKKEQIHSKIFTIVLWIVPVVTIVTMTMLYMNALNIPVAIHSIVYILIGMLFILLGNYMHKIKQNYTIGIRVPWTLNSEQNWNQTHRFASWVFILAGMICLIDTFFDSLAVMIISLLIASFLPILYSFILYKKENKVTETTR